MTTHNTTTEEIDQAWEQADNGRQNAEIVVADEAPLEFGESGAISIHTSDDLKRVARLIFSSDTMQISGARNQTDIAIALMHGMEAGLSPTQCIKNIMIVNGKPAIWGDTLQALALNSGELADMSEAIDDTGEVATCRIVRVKALIDGSFGRITTERTFSRGDAEKAGLWGKRGPWSQYPKRMLQMRARAFALRDAFADRLGGLHVTEEARDYSTFDADRVKGPRGSASRTLSEGDGDSDE